jgi:hypothetical protein
LISLLDTALVAAGWTKAFSGTNKAAYRQGGGNQFYLRVQDDSPGAGVAREARITGYETMSDVDTGTGPFPTAAQGVGGIAMLVARKSATADATARNCVMICDNRTMYFLCLTGDLAGNYYGFGFGDFFSLVPSDGYRTFINGRTGENTSGASTEKLDAVSGFINSAQPGFFIARGYTGLGTSINAAKSGDHTKSGVGTLLGIVPFPNPANGELFVSPVWIGDPVTSPANNIRGRMRGFWHQCHPLAALTDLDTFTGVGDLAGKTFKLYKQGGNTGIYCIETSNTLETN